MTVPLMDDVTVEQFDYAKPCVDCSETATAFVQISHSTSGCWSPGVFRCSKCLDEKLREFADWLIQHQGRRCNVASGGNGDLVVGGLAENTRVMPI